MMTRFACVKFLGLLLLSLTVLTGCEKRHEIEGGEGRKMAAEHADWFGFTPYPVVRQLCDEFVEGQSSGKPMGIHWTSYATQDTTEKVVGFYLKTQDGNVEIGKESITIRRGENGVEAALSVHAASTTDYPTCGNEPQHGEKTVINVSRRSGP